jgi:hypothetical protein
MTDFVTDGETVLPGVKSDTRLASGLETEWAAADANMFRQSVLDIRAAMLPVVNAKTMYGAGGTADDTAAVRAALLGGAGKRIFFPAGVYTVDVSTSWLAVSSWTTIFGEGDATIFRVKASSGSYPAIFSSTGGVQWTPTTDVRFHDFCVDQNTANNSFDIHDGVLAEVASPIYFNYVTGLTVDRVTFKDTCAVQTVSAIGGAYVHEVKVRDCKFTFLRSGTHDYDSSAIYIDGSDFTVTGNFLKDPAMLWTRGAMEVHGGPGVVANNVTNGYRDGLNIVRTATSVPDGMTEAIANRVHITVTGNTFSRCGQGIILHPMVNAADICDGVTIAGNTIELNNVDRGYSIPNGIQFVALPAYVGGFRNISITGNTIIAQPDVANASIPGADCGGIICQPYGSVTGLTITGNIVRGFPSNGIRFAPQGVAKSVDIKANLVVDCGNDASLSWWMRNAIYAYGALTDVAICNNTISHTGASFGCYGSIFIPAGGTWTRVTVRGNTVDPAFTLSIAAEAGISTDMVAHANVSGSITLADLATNYNTLLARLRAAGVLMN